MVTRNENPIADALDAILEEVGEVRAAYGGLAAEVAASRVELRRLASAIDGGDQHDGIRTKLRLQGEHIDQLAAQAEGIKEKLALLLTDLRQVRAALARPEVSGPNNALAIVETARAEADKSRWAALGAGAKAAGPYLAAAAAWAAAHFRVLLPALVLTTLAACSSPAPPPELILSCDPGETLYSYTSTHGPTLACRRSTDAPPTWRPLR